MAYHVCKDLKKDESLTPEHCTVISDYIFFLSLLTIDWNSLCYRVTHRFLNAVQTLTCHACCHETGDPHLFERLFVICWENNRDCHITMPLSLKTMEVQIEGDQWNKRFRTVQVYWWNKPQSQQQGSWLLSWTYQAICLGPWDRVHQAPPPQSPNLQTRTGNTWQWFQNESVWIKQQQKRFSPATHAVMKQATVPATSARRATRAMSGFLDGASGPMPPIWIPIEAKLAKPHNAYVAIISERICYKG